ncbi:hypothetical protein ACTQ1Z_08410 [Parolsenella sp. LCP21S3_E11]|uniref:hypothetical protein n=1 Tax=Parolsenella sp. LCP21S3_E11 TaxID=3438797 RepID=UPI003F95FB9D
MIATGDNGIIGGNFAHYAADSHNDNSIADSGPFLRINGGGAFLLLEAVRRYGRAGAQIVRSPLNCRRS